MLLWSSQNSNCQDLPKFQFSGEGRYSGVVKTAKIPNFNLGGYSGVVKTQTAKICLNFNFRGGYSGVVKTQTAKICLNFNGDGMGGGGTLE